MRLERLAVERAAPIGHVENRQQCAATDSLPVKELDDLLESPLRKRRGDHRHDDQIGGAHDLLAHLGQARRAIENDPVIIAAEALKQLLQPLFLAEPEKKPVEPAKRGIGREQVEALVLGLLDQLARGDVAREDRLGLLRAGGLAAHQIG